MINDINWTQITSETAGQQVEVTYENYNKIKLFEDVGYFLLSYVVSGGSVTKNVGRNDMVDATQIVVSLRNNIMSRTGNSFKTSIKNTTYYLDFVSSGDWYWGITHPPGIVAKDYLTVARVTTDANGMVNVITDVRGTVGGFRLSDDYGLLDYAKKNYGGLDRLAATSNFVTTLASYIGLVNYAYLGDNGTRFYILPKGKVTTGVGGTIKIFGDDYQNNADYRDMGWYFHADQLGDKGYHGNGVFWFNSKVLDNGVYANKNPDIGFSFQDGQIVGGRWISLFNAVPRAVLLIGPGLPIHAPANTEIGLEIAKAIALHAGQRFYMATDETGVFNSFRTLGKKVTHSLASGGGEEKYIAGVKKSDLTEHTNEIANALITTSRRNILTDTSTINAQGVNRVVVNQPNPNTITSISGGVDGQELFVLNVAGNSSPQKTTIQHNSTIKLSTGSDYAMGFNHTLTLECVGSTWYEKCRSPNG